MRNRQYFGIIFMFAVYFTAWWCSMAFTCRTFKLDFMLSCQCCFCLPCLYCLVNARMTWQVMLFGAPGCEMPYWRDWSLDMFNQMSCTQWVRCIHVRASSLSTPAVFAFMLKMPEPKARPVQPKPKAVSGPSQPLEPPPPWVKLGINKPPPPAPVSCLW